MGTEPGVEGIEESETPSSFDSPPAWKEGAGAGLVAAVVMGIGITIGNAETLRATIAGLYGFEGSLLAGWVFHVLHGTLFGVVFAAVLWDPGLFRLTDWPWKTVLAGVVYGLALAIVGAGFVMPLWLSTVGLDATPSVPSLSTPMIVYHLIYGFVLGLAYETLVRW